MISVNISKIPVFIFKRLLDKQPSNGRKLEEIDGIRGLAVLLVVADHTGAFYQSGQGGAGVWLFYVLSGFLLTNIMCSKLPESLTHIQLVKYFIRRIFRILPLYYTILLFKFIFKGKNFQWFFRHITFQQADGHFWSIPQEELFYLILPLLVALVFVPSKFIKIKTPISAVLLFVVVQLTHPLLTLNGNGKDMSFFLNIFITGLLLSYLYRMSIFQKILNSRFTSIPLTVLGLISLLYIVYANPTTIDYLNKTYSITFLKTSWEAPFLYSVLSSILVLSSLNSNGLLHSFFCFKPLRIVGVLSFSIYLFHQQIKLIFLKGLHIPSGEWLFLPTLFFSVILALFTEYVIESPSMKFGKILSNRLAGFLENGKTREKQSA